MSWSFKNKLKDYILLEGEDLILVNYDGIDMEARQIFQAYDSPGRYRTGLIITNTDIKSLSLLLRKRKNLYRGSLYIKAATEKHGVWELTMKDVRFKQLEDDTIWFRHDGISALQILTKPESR
jgi:hypothetical protein